MSTNPNESTIESIVPSTAVSTPSTTSNDLSSVPGSVPSSTIDPIFNPPPSFGLDPSPGSSTHHHGPPSHWVGANVTPTGQNPNRNSPVASPPLILAFLMIALLTAGVLSLFVMRAWRERLGLRQPPSMYDEDGDINGMGDGDHDPSRRRRKERVLQKRPALCDVWISLDRTLWQVSERNSTACKDVDKAGHDEKSSTLDGTVAAMMNTPVRSATDNSAACAGARRHSVICTELSWTDMMPLSATVTVTHVLTPSRLDHVHRVGTGRDGTGSLRDSNYTPAFRAARWSIHQSVQPVNDTPRRTSHSRILPWSSQKLGSSFDLNDLSKANLPPPKTLRVAVVVLMPSVKYPIHQTRNVRAPSREVNEHDADDEDLDDDGLVLKQKERQVGSHGIPEYCIGLYEVPWAEVS